MTIEEGVRLAEGRLSWRRGSGGWIVGFWRSKLQSLGAVTKLCIEKRWETDGWRMDYEELMFMRKCVFY